MHSAETFQVVADAVGVVFQRLLHKSCKSTTHGESENVGCKVPMSRKTQGSQKGTERVFETPGIWRAEEASVSREKLWSPDMLQKAALG